MSACAGGDTPGGDTAASAAQPPGGGTATAAAGGGAGQSEYAVCAACHQADGKGLAGTFPPLAGSEWVTGDPNIPIAIVLHGMQGPVTVAGQQYNSLMAPLGTLSDEQIAAILTYERSSWGNSASPVTAAQVAQVRAATSSRTQPWTAAEVRSAKLQ